MKKRTIKISVKKKQAVMFASLLIAIPLLVGGIAVSTNSLNKTTATPTPDPIPQAVTHLIDTVNKKITLPPDETPTVATVTNVSALQKQTFFAKAKNGDKVLIYMYAKRAFLYRPSTDQIIQTAPVEIEASDASGSAQASQSATLDTSQNTQEASGEPVLRVRL